MFAALAPLMRDAWTGAGATAIGAGATATAGVWLLIRFGFEPLNRKLEDREAALRHETLRQEFGARLNRALERARTEADVLSVTMRAVETVDPALPAEALIADSSRAHLRRQAQTGAAGPGSGCRVVSPWDCPAMSTSQTHHFPDSGELDACPFLRERAEAVGHALTAVCLPMASRGQAVGVLHASTAVDHPIVADEQSLLASIAGRTGVTIGATRAFAKTQLQASTDPLTGLLNRRSFEESAAAALEGAARFGLIMADLDNFKTLNDLHGHSTGDRALRQFAEVLRSIIRPDIESPLTVRQGTRAQSAAPIVARIGGEEFLILLPDADLQETADLGERLRTELRRSAVGSTPTFTVSLGVAEGSCRDDLGAVMAAADRALFAAKAAGRDQVVTANVPAAAPAAPSALPVQRAGAATPV